MVRQAIDRQSGVFTPDEADHLNVALSQINEKIRQVLTPVISWHYDVKDIDVDNSITNSSVKVGPYYFLNFSFKADITFSNMYIPDQVITAVDENGHNYQVRIQDNMIKGNALGRMLRVSAFFIQ